jgi:hypothetical protein
MGQIFSIFWWISECLDLCLSYMFLDIVYPESVRPIYQWVNSNHRQDGESIPVQ